MADIVGLLLAAGASRRFGSPKLLAQTGGRPLVLCSADALSACDSTLAVVRAEDHRLQQLLHQAGIAMVFNHNAENGIGSSIAAGVRASEECAGWCILPADMPYLQADTVQAIVTALRGGAALAAPCYRTQRGHPVGFSSRFKDELLALNGDLGARTILASHPDQLVRLAVNDAGILRDVDRPEALQDT